jgi:hypothetical protein
MMQMVPHARIAGDHWPRLHQWTHQVLERRGEELAVTARKKGKRKVGPLATAICHWAASGDDGGEGGRTNTEHAFTHCGDPV